MVTPAFFTRSAAGFVPTELPLSPWNKETLNGIAMSGLLASVLGSMAPTPTGGPMAFARLTIDLLGAAPRAEIVPSFRILRDGARMQLLQVELSVKDRVYARCTALRVRVTDTPAGETPVGVAPPDAWPRGPASELGVLKYTDVRIVAGRNRESGPGMIWLKFGYELVAGEALTPLVRSAMSADYPGGIGNMLNADAYSWPNLDITVYLTREPVGEWLLIEAFTESAGTGTAVASARLADLGGSFARTHQTIYVERTEAAPRAW